MKSDRNLKSNLGTSLSMWKEFFVVHVPYLMVQIVNSALIYGIKTGGDQETLCQVIEPDPLRTTTLTVVCR